MTAAIKTASIGTEWVSRVKTDRSGTFYVEIPKGCLDELGINVNSLAQDLLFVEARKIRVRL